MSFEFKCELQLAHSKMQTFTVKSFCSRFTFTFGLSTADLGGWPPSHYSLKSLGIRFPCDDDKLSKLSKAATNHPACWDDVLTMVCSAILTPCIALRVFPQITQALLRCSVSGSSANEQFGHGRSLSANLHMVDSLTELLSSPNDSFKPCCTGRLLLPHRASCDVL